MWFLPLSAISVMHAQCARAPNPLPCYATAALLPTGQSALAATMLAVGLATPLSEFRRVLRSSGRALDGWAAQLLAMPLLALALCYAVGLPLPYAIGWATRGCTYATSAVESFCLQMASCPARVLCMGSAAWLPELLAASRPFRTPAVLLSASAHTPVQAVPGGLLPRRLCSWGGRAPSRSRCAAQRAASHRCGSDTSHSQCRAVAWSL